MRVSVFSRCWIANTSTMRYFTKIIILCLLALPVSTLSVIVEDEDGVIDVSQEQPVFDFSIHDMKLYSRIIVSEKWSEDEVDAFIRIIEKESSWVHNKEHYPNGRSSATGLAGFLLRTWGNVGCEKTYDQYVQLECATRYIESRYGTPTKALAFHNKKNWY